MHLSARLHRRSVASKDALHRARPGVLAGELLRAIVAESVEATK
jgi:hypothetical protein